MSFNPKDTPYPPVPVQVARDMDPLHQDMHDRLGWLMPFTAVMGGVVAALFIAGILLTVLP